MANIKQQREWLKMQLTELALDAHDCEVRAESAQAASVTETMRQVKMMIDEAIGRGECEAVRQMSGERKPDRVFKPGKRGP